MKKEKPKLSDDTIRRMRQIGLDPEEMSAEQLEALESIEKPEKSHWLTKLFTSIGGFLELMALFSLIGGEWGSAFGYGIEGVILMYIGYRIQTRIAAKKFVQASIKKDMEKREQKAQKLWQQFSGMKNTDDVIAQKAKAIAPFIVALAAVDTKSVFEQLKKDEDRKIDDKFGEVFFEMVLFYLHFIDRIAFQYLGAEQRNIFIDALFVEVGEQLSRAYENGIDAAGFRAAFGEAFNERQNEYGQYKKMFPEKDEGAGGTLLWEFGKKIAGVLGNEMDIVVILYVRRVVYLTMVYSLTALQLPELFQE